MIKENSLNLEKSLVKKLLEEKKALLLDVRTSEEYEEINLENSINIPLSELMTRFEELDPQKTYIVFCAHGIRSLNGTYMLREAGLKNFYNSQEGIATW